MKRFILFIFFLTCISAAYAIHIKGGWIQYTYKGATSNAANKSDYIITIYVFRSCVNSGPMPSAVGVYDAKTNVNAVTVNIGSAEFVLSSIADKKSFDPCINNPPSVCYQVYSYSTTVSLPNNTNGYIIAAEDANRVSGIVNIANSSATGICFTATIPGTVSGNDYHINSSPYFEFRDTAIICYGSSFSYQVNATDADGDSLSYAFGNGLNGKPTLTSPPYSPLSYISPYSGAQPLGSTVTIDPSTGLISGTAPNITGEFVIAVYVTEWRDGVNINTTKKELQINVANCTLTSANLKPVYINCTDYSFTFQNESSSIISSYLWDFGVPGSSPPATSTKATPTWTYKDTGTYTLKLLVANNGGCKDSATAKVKVYPKFIASFITDGVCFQAPVIFTDKSTATFGDIISWSWDFGDKAVTTGTSSLQNPVYAYSKPGSYTASLNITSSKGCTSSYSTNITVNDKPYLHLPFTDTLICSIDSLPFTIQTAGTPVWTPNSNITDIHSTNPIVFPKDTTVYKVVVTDKSCVDSATITVNVLQFISVKFVADTFMCKTDSITLKPISYALSYAWKETSNTNSLNNYFIKNPKASPAQTTTYYVKANLGYCQDSSKITVYVGPYPTANAGADTIICFGSRIQLNASATGSAFIWNAANTLYKSNTLNPIAGPLSTTSYILTAKGTAYCPKSISDTITISVIPMLPINAGRDTSVVINQPLQLKATGDTTLSYQWYPQTGLNNPFIYNPVGIYSSTDPDSIKYTVKVSSKEGCYNTDDIWVRIYKSNPDIWVPSGFTPNNDNRNDILKPILVGVTQLHFFNIYNRWGQLIFSTSTPNKGWDGTFNGVQQSNGTYIYTAEGVDYMGNTISRKGTVVLIR